MTDGMSRLAAALEDRYRIERELGRGGMATVYLAHDLKHNRKVALKVLLPELAALLGAERFLKEIEVTANLQHPHILPLFDSGKAEGRTDGGAEQFLYYVMPYVEGESLRDRLTREKQLPIADAVRIATEAAAALDYAHRQGVIHRDIKPENVLLRDGQAMVADFGIALAVREAGGARLTGTGLSVGTPSYMSPEQAMGDRELDARSDVYSLGAMLYEMLAGEPPFTGGTAQAVVAKILTEAAPLVSKTRATVPPNVTAAVYRALQRLPADRFTSAADFAAALADPAFTVPSLAPMGLTPTGARSLWNPLSAAAVAGTVVALALAAWLAFRPGPVPRVERFNLALPAGRILTPGNRARMALSADGRRLVYHAAAPESADGLLYWRDLEILEPTPIAGSTGAVAASFSPDGKRLVFNDQMDANHLKIASLSGAPLLTLVDSGTSGGGVAWSADDYIYFDAGTRLDRVRANGGAREVVVSLDTADAEVGFAWPEPLPNGRGLLYRSRREGETEPSYNIKILDLRTRASRVLVRGVVARYAASGHLLYVTADGTLMAAPFDQDRLELTGSAIPLVEGLAVGRFGSVDLAVSASGALLYSRGESTGGGRRLVWVNRDGGAEGLDLEPDEAVADLVDFALSPDGRRVLLQVGGLAGSPRDLWVKDLGGPLSKLTFDGRSSAAAWSGDGQTVFYFSRAADGSGQSFRLNADGTGTPQPMPTDSRGVGEHAASRDGRWVVVATDPTQRGYGDILAFRPGIDTVLTPLLGGEREEREPVLSPDGRWLAYASNESGRLQVYVRPFPDVGRAKWQVSISGGGAPRWAHSGRELFYVALGQQLTAAEIMTEPAFSVGRRQTLFSTGPYPGLQYEVAPDGRRFMMLGIRGRGLGEQVELVLVRNLFQDLKGKFGRGR